MTYDRALRLAIHSFHKTDKPTARQYLEDLILRQQQKRKFMNAPRVNRIRSDLESYMRWCISSGDTIIDSDFILRDTSGGFLTLGGKISRLDLTPEGYRAVLFGVPSGNWKEELRMPLIQYLIAEMYSRPVDEIVVGFQHFDGSNLKVARFSDSEIRTARRRFRALGDSLQSESTL